MNLLATFCWYRRPQLTSSAVASALTAAIISTTHTPHHPTLALTTVATALISSSTATSPPLSLPPLALTLLANPTLILTLPLR